MDIENRKFCQELIFAGRRARSADEPYLHTQQTRGLWSPGRALNPRPLPPRERSIETLLPRQRFRLLLDIYQAEPPGLRWSQNDLLIKFRLGSTHHFHGHIAATSGL